MIEIAPLKYGVIFKHAFSQPEVFIQFVKDVLGIEMNIDKVYTEYEYPRQVGFVRSKYDLFAEDKKQRTIVEIQQIKEEDFFDRFLYYHLTSLIEQVGGFQEYNFERTVHTIVVLTSIPRDGSVNFSVAVSDMDPIDEYGKKLSIYPHRLVFLCPRLVNVNTHPTIKKWLEFIEDSLDGKIEENNYSEKVFQNILSVIRKNNIDPDKLSKIKDEAAWEKAKQRFRKESREDGIQEGIQQGIQEGIQQGIQKGIQKGIQEGEKMKALETARKMHEKGFSVEEIIELTGINFDF